MSKARDISNIASGTNTAVGEDALENNTASNNTAVGYQAMYTVTTSSENTALGYQAGYNASNVETTYVGFKAGYGVTTGASGTAVGRLALGGNSAGVTGGENVAVGNAAMYVVTSGADNVAVGSLSMFDNTTGSYNTALGSDALRSNTTASNNTAVGYQAGYNTTTAGENAFFGSQSGYAVTTGVQNSFIGEDAGSAVTTGSKNAILGSYNGNQGGLDIRTSSNNIVLSDGDGNPRVHVDANHNITLGSTGGLFGGSGGGASLNLTTSRNGAVYFITSDFDCLWVEQGKSGGGTAGTFTRNGGGDLIRFKTTTTQVGTIGTNGSTTSYNTSSDYRLKENVVELTGATDRLKQIPVHRFNFIADPNTTVDGFLAHEVQAIVPEAITGTKDEVDADGNPVYQGIDQSKLVPLLVATIKELEARIAALEAK